MLQISVMGKRETQHTLTLDVLGKADNGRDKALEAVRMAFIKLFLFSCPMECRVAGRVKKTRHARDSDPTIRALRGQKQAEAPRTLPHVM